MNRELCKVCGKRGYSCCQNIQPLLTEEEAAKIYFEKGDLVPDNVQLTRVQDGMFIFAPKSIIRDNKIYINDADCVFYDKENQSCKIYDIRPQVCRDYGDKVPCPFKDLTPEELSKLSDKELRERSKSSIDLLATKKYAVHVIQSFRFSNILRMPKFNKKYLKSIKEDGLMIVVTYYINEMAENHDRYYLKHINQYRLILLDNNRISSLRLDKIVTRDENKDKIFNTVAKLHNFLFNKIVSKPLEYQQILVDKVNKLLKGLTLKDCELCDEIKSQLTDDQIRVIQYYVFAATLFKLYKDNYKGKSKSYQGFKNDDLLKVFQDATEITGGYDYEGSLRKLFFNDFVRCIQKNAETAYKHIITQIK